MAAFASEEAAAVADAVHRFCVKAVGESLHDSALVPLYKDLWRSLGDMGILALRPGPGTGENGLLAAAALMLGRFAFPGPLPATFLATALLDEERASPVAEGAAIVSVGPGPAMPWADLASVFIAVDGENAALVEGSPGDPVETLGGEGWARLEVASETPLGSWRAFSCHYDLPLAAYLIGGAERLLEETAAYAAERKQFGRAIGDFQGVALPLAAVSTRIDAARNLLAYASHRMDCGLSDAGDLVTAVRTLASDAARETASVAHQTFGAFGIVKQGPVFALSRRFQQWSGQEPVTPLPDTLVALASGASLSLIAPNDGCLV
jgi:alkylation response protein AidB-like acyl-CoA dehydrogenase